MSVQPLSWLRIEIGTPNKTQDMLPLSLFVVLVNAFSELNAPILTGN
jgi:hypothetical protein